jgi:four helix bundle protein
MYALVGQMRRAAISIPSNIAEGSARTGNKELLQFLSIARGSLSELETQVYIAKELNYLKDEAELLMRIDKIFGLMGGLIKSVRARESK